MNEHSEVTEERTIHLQKSVRWLDTNLHSFRRTCGREQHWILMISKYLILSLSHWTPVSLLVETKYSLLSVVFFGRFETSYGLPNFLTTQTDTVRQMLISS